MKEYRRNRKSILIFTATFLFGALAFLTLLFFGLRDPSWKEPEFILFAFLVASLPGLPPILLTFNYIAEDYNKTLILDSQTGNILIRKRNNEISVNKRDIIRVYYVRGYKRYPSQYNFIGYEYVILLLKEKQRLYITSLICDPKTIIDFTGLESINISKLIPFIGKKIGSDQLTASELDKRISEFVELYKNKTNSELISISDNKDQYADYAIKAAQRVLENRELH